MAELPIDLRQLEPVRGALNILRYLYKQDNYAADGDDIMDDLGLSSRGWDKAKRRLVTRSYIQMQTDFIYELTSKGKESAQILLDFDGADDDGGAGDEKLQRQVVLALPRNLVFGQTSALKIGIEPSDNFGEDASLVLRITAINADIGDWNEMVTLNSDALIVETTITPQPYQQARIKLEVYQFSPAGDDLSDCGGMYVDVAVLESGDTGEMIGYSADLEFEL
ncbi:MAG: hypothetical protein Q9P44_09890 [Anaerolineae bacterium]|nr:hypothetical protein [Anaerolineae bacterium]